MYICAATRFSLLMWDMSVYGIGTYTDGAEHGRLGIRAEIIALTDILGATALCSIAKLCYYWHVCVLTSVLSLPSPVNGQHCY